MAEVKIPGNIADEVVRSGHTFAKILLRAHTAMNPETGGFNITMDERHALAVDLVIGADVLSESLEVAGQLMDDQGVEVREAIKERKEESSRTSDQ